MKDENFVNLFYQNLTAFWWQLHILDMNLF